MMGEEMVNVADQTVVVHRRASSILNKANRPVTLKFEDVIYKVVPKTGGVLKNSKGEEKIILKGVNGIVLPGEMLAMLGPSGSGKTTLLTALGGRLSGRLSGTITYNGNPFSSVIKRNMGFVTQDDVLYPTLTVTETLVFTALLRLPNSLTKQEKTAQAEAVIEQLGLSRCKNSIIGGGIIRGVSGGERKRVSIGLEMLINPSLLLLDEPTSGLDSTTAQKIISTLWDLANGGKTIVMTIHQPSSRVFYMFHKVVLLSEGNMIYFGKGAEAMDYFARVGYSPSVAMNPADYLMDLANGISSDNGQEDPAEIKSDLVSAFKENLVESLKASILENSGGHHNVKEEKRSDKWATTWWQQFAVLFRRGLKERSHETFAPLRIGQVLAVALLSGLLWWQSTTSHLQDQIGLLFFYTGFWGFYPVFQALFTFPPERKMLEKERSSGMYRLSSYFAARTFGDLPMELVLPTAFVTITYFMGGLKRVASNYFRTLFSVLLSVLTSQSFGLALGALVMDTKSASTLASVILLAFQLAGGFFVTHVPHFILWVRYISFSQYTYKLLLSSQYKPHETYPCQNNSTCLVGDFPQVKLIGLGGQEGVSVIALVVMALAYRFIAYLALMRIGVTKH